MKNCQRKIKTENGRNEQDATIWKQQKQSSRSEEGVSGKLVWRVLTSLGKIGPSSMEDQERNRTSQFLHVRKRGSSTCKSLVHITFQFKERIF